MAQTFLLPEKDRDRIAANMHAFVLSTTPGKKVRVTVEVYRKSRSNQQSRYLNGVAYKLLGEATGYERNDISEYLCLIYFGGKDKKVPGGKIVQVPLRTTTTNEQGERDVMNTVDFAAYVDFVQRFGAKHGVYIPNPDEE
jgi:hypothetical protein